MSYQGHDLSMCDTVASQSVGNDTKRFTSLTLEELAKESPRRPPVSTALYENVNHVAVLIYRTPEIVALSIDCHEHFVQVPRVTETALTPFQPASVLRSELDGSLSDRFISHVHATLGEQIFDLAKTETEPIVGPDSVTDDLWRKAMPNVTGLASLHPGIVPRGELT